MKNFIMKINQKFGKNFLRIIKKKYVCIPLAAIISIALLYSLLVFSSIPQIAFLRGLWIETAMTTADHQWLATAFIPKYIIDDVMNSIPDNSEVIGGEDHLVETTAGEDTSSADTEPVTEPIAPDTTVQEEVELPPEVTDILGQASLEVGQKDYAGNTVLINDIEQGIVVSEVKGASYRGQIMLIDDPSRVYLGTTTMKGTEGLRIRAMMSHYGAIAGINASGFSDPNDSGHGGDIIGLSFSDGEYWGSPVSYYGAVLMTTDNKLVVGNVRDWEKYDLRAGIQFGPVLIADGQIKVEGSNGYGIHPRTAIGQREDGVIVFAIIDGRQPTWSIGCTVGELAKIMAEYDVVNASCCDGGSSSVLAYKGEVINKNSSLNPSYGRRLPNAWLVAPKEINND